MESEDYNTVEVQVEVRTRTRHDSHADATYIQCSRELLVALTYHARKRLRLRAHSDLDITLRGYNL